MKRPQNPVSKRNNVIDLRFVLKHCQTDLSSNRFIQYIIIFPVLYVEEKVYSTLYDFEICPASLVWVCAPIHFLYTYVIFVNITVFWEDFRE